MPNFHSTLDLINLKANLELLNSIKIIEKDRKQRSYKTKSYPQIYSLYNDFRTNLSKQHFLQKINLQKLKMNL